MYNFSIAFVVKIIDITQRYTVVHNKRMHNRLRAILLQITLCT